MIKYKTLYKIMAEEVFHLGDDFVTIIKGRSRDCAYI